MFWSPVWRIAQVSVVVNDQCKPTALNSLEEKKTSRLDILFFSMYVHVVLPELLALVFRSFGLLICSVFISFLRKVNTKEPTEKNIEKKTDNCDRLSDYSNIHNKLPNGNFALLWSRPKGNIESKKNTITNNGNHSSSHFIDVFGIFTCDHLLHLTAPIRRWWQRHGTWGE